MTASTTTLISPCIEPPARGMQRSIADLLGPMDRVAAGCSRILATTHGRYQRDGATYFMPRYLHVGRRGGGETMRVGIFASIHGDEPEGALAVARLIEHLAETPDTGEGYELFLYPLCNPSGYEDNTRYSRSGKDLNREFWRSSAEPEVIALESEIRTLAFDGIITLHSDDTSDGLYGFVRGAVLSEHLLKPALIEAGRFLPQNHGETIDGFDAHHGVIRSGYPGMLQSAPDTGRLPFEITLETPHLASVDRQVDAFVAALKTILSEFRCLQAMGQNI